MPWISGTSSTGRTGERASRYSAASAPRTPCPAHWRTRRTPSTSSSRWSPAATRVSASGPPASRSRWSDSSGENLRTPLDHLAGDDRALHLARPLPDPLHPQFAVEPFGHVLPHVAAAAEHLDGTVGDPPGHLGAVQLRHGALGVRDLYVGAPVDGPRC